MIGLLLAIIYLAFIGLGLPDAVLGSVWPLASVALGTSIASMGIVTIIISAGSIVSSLLCDRLIRKLGIYQLTVLSVGLTAVALLGFALSPNFVVLCLWAVPYGLGAGSVDAALNNYAAIHFESKHMIWLHCMWGLGATLGPYLMAMALTVGLSFRGGYVVLFGIQIVFTAIIFFSRPVWQSTVRTPHTGASDAATVGDERPPTMLAMLKVKGVPQAALAFFCFCALEQTTGIWASSYLVFVRGVDAETAVAFTALFYLGITVGRAVNGFLSTRFNDTQMIRAGCAIMAVGIVTLLLPIGQWGAYVGLALVGLGSSPVYPCLMHATPHHFGAERSQIIIGMQTTCAYIAILLMPTLFGVIGNQWSFAFYPLYLAVFLLSLFALYESLLRHTHK